MISYAQNFEDVMLWRALKHVEQGFYIDIGANDPTIDSVTKAFYEREWRGINIEPLKSHYNDLQVERLRDINLCCAVGATSGEIEIFECDIRGWATAEKSVANKYVREGRKGVYHYVPLRTLSDICQEYVLGEIHFLKIDVEGLEKDVISGADFQKFRPWIMVIEATKSNSTEEVYEQWENLLFDVSYQFVYADGLNRFYVANERTDLLPAFKYPPNVFDDFVLNVQQQAEVKAQQFGTKAQQAESKVQQAERRAEQAEAKATEAQSKAQQSESRAQQSEMKAQQAEAKASEAQSKAQQAEMLLNSIYVSRSWRITAPLRGISSAIRRLSDPSNPGRFLLFRLMRFFFRFFRLLFRSPFGLPVVIFEKIKHFIKRILIEVTRWLEKRPLLRKVAVLSLKPFPWVKNFLRKANYFSRNEQNAGHVYQPNSGNVFPISNAEQELSIDEILSRIRAEINEFNEKKD